MQSYMLTAFYIQELVKDCFLININLHWFKAHHTDVVTF